MCVWCVIMRQIYPKHYTHLLVANVALLNIVSLSYHLILRRRRELRPYPNRPKFIIIQAMNSFNRNPSIHRSRSIFMSQLICIIVQPLNTIGQIRFDLLKLGFPNVLLNIWVIISLCKAFYQSFEIIDFV